MSKPADTPVAEINDAIVKVAAKQDEWAALGAAEKLGILREMKELLKVHVDEWIKAAAAGHGYDLDNPDHAHLVGELYAKGPSTLAQWIVNFEFLYNSLVTAGKPPTPGNVVKRPDGTVHVKVFPVNGFQENVFASGVELFVNTKGGGISQYDPLEEKAGCMGILGAGNYDPPTDILDTMFLHNKVAVFKHNPVNCHAAPAIQKVFAPLISRGFLFMACGGIPQGSAIVDHEKTDSLFMTGSCRTYDAIVWGTSDKEKKSQAKPKVSKEFLAELGSVNPWVVVPGRTWTDAEIDAQAQLLVVSKMFNNGHICASPQVIVTSKEWKQRDAFLSKVREYLKGYPATRPYYPNSDKSYAQHLKHVTDDEKKEDAPVVQNPKLFDDQHHPIFATGLKEDCFATQNEAFCPVLTEVPLEASTDLKEFLPAAANFVNKMWGSLSAMISVDNETMKLKEFDEFVDSLQVGCVSINQFSGYAPFFPQLLWGAYPGKHSQQDVQSGIGQFGGSFCLNNTIKSIIKAPFTYPSQAKVPKPGNTAAALKQNQRLFEFVLHRSGWRLFKLIVNSVTGL